MFARQVLRSSARVWAHRAPKHAAACADCSRIFAIRSPISSRKKSTAAVEFDKKTHEEAWMINLARNDDDVWLTGPRPKSWFTGVPPADCPGLADGSLRSLPLPNLSRVTRQSALDYFDNSWTLYETLFAGLKGEEGFYRPPVHGLRHPQIFYYGHTACLYINKLRVSGVLQEPVVRIWDVG